MAICNGPLGPLSGRVGNLVFYYTRGNSYVRSRPSKSKRAPSGAQLAHRAKFGLAVGFLSPLRECIKVGFFRKGSKISPFNQAMKILLKEAIVGQHPDFRIDFTKVQLSKGNLEGLIGLAFNECGMHPALDPEPSTVPKQVKLSWSWSLQRFDAAGNDLGKVVLYNATSKFFSIHEDAFRSDRSTVIDVPGALAGDSLHAYVIVQSLSGICSNSRYAGEVVV